MSESATGSARLRLDDGPPEPEEQHRPPSDPAPSEPEPPPQPEPGETEPEPQKEPEPETARSFKERLDRERREKYEARTRAEAAERQLEQIRRQWEQAQRGQQPNSEAEARAYQRFVQEQADRDLTTQCNALFRHGQEEYGNFREDVDRLNSVGAGNNRLFLQAVSNLPEGHRVYHALAEDLDEANRIVRLADTDPMRMVTELARIAVSNATAPSNGRELSAPRQASAAPPPIRPIGGNSSRATNLERVPMSEYVRIMDQREIERRRRGER